MYRWVAMRWIVVMAMGLGGCSLLFQEHEASYSVHHEPRCTNVPGWWLWDGANVVAGTAAIVHGAYRSTPSGGLVTIAATSALFSLVSAVSGHHWASECDRARRDYDSRDVDEPANRAKPQPESPVVTESTPKPFFCTSTGTTSVCTRNRASCNLARDEMLSDSDLVDMTMCAPAEHAWCFDRDAGAEQCFAERDACTARIARNVQVQGHCEERP